jgi:hypothetical protein
MTYTEYLLTRKRSFIYPLLGPSIVFLISAFVTNMTFVQALVSYVCVTVVMVALTLLSLRGDLTHYREMEELKKQLRIGNKETQTIIRIIEVD